MVVPSYNMASSLGETASHLMVIDKWQPILHTHTHNDVHECDVTTSTQSCVCAMYTSTAGSLYIQNPKSLITITFDPQKFVTIRVCNSKLIYACVLSVASFPGSPPIRWRHFIVVVWEETLGTRLHSANMLNGSLS